MARNKLSLRWAILRLEDLCFLKTRKDIDGKAVSLSVHSMICKWRLETTEIHAREDWIMLAAYTLSIHLPSGSLGIGVRLKYFPLVKHMQDMINKYVDPSNLEAPLGRLRHPYGSVAERFFQIYEIRSSSPDVEQAERMLRWAIAYRMIEQGSDWPKDRQSLSLFQNLARMLSKRGNRGEAAEVLESFTKDCSKLIDSQDEMFVWAKTKLRDLRDRKMTDAHAQRRAIIASRGEKRRPRSSKHPPKADPLKAKASSVTDLLSDYPHSSILYRSISNILGTDSGIGSPPIRAIALHMHNVDDPIALAIENQDIITIYSLVRRGPTLHWHWGKLGEHEGILPRYYDFQNICI